MYECCVIRSFPLSPDPHGAVGLMAVAELPVARDRGDAWGRGKTLGARVGWHLEERLSIYLVRVMKW